MFLLGGNLAWGRLDCNSKVQHVNNSRKKKSERNVKRYVRIMADDLGLYEPLSADEMAARVNTTPSLKLSEQENEDGSDSFSDDN